MALILKSMKPQKNNFADEVIANIFSAENQVNSMLDEYGLNWRVSKRPLLLPGEISTPFYGIVRDDNQTTFSTCKGTYEPFQNEQLAELLFKIVEQTGYELHTGGMFNGGGKVFIQLSTGNQLNNIGLNHDTVKGFVTGINSHDGTAALKWGAVNFTISCSNTFAYAQRELQNSARHTTSIHQKVELSLRSITGIIEQEKSLFDKFIKLSEIAVSKKHIQSIVENVTGVDTSLTPKDAKEKFSSHAINRSADLLSSIAGEMGTKGQTLWGLFSGVTHYTTHVMPAPKRDNGRLESKYTGKGLEVDNSALKAVLELA